MAKQPVEQNVEFESVSIHPENFAEGRIDNVDAAIIDAYYLPWKFERGKFWSLFARVFFRCTQEYGGKEFSELYEVGRLDSLFPAMKDKKGKYALSGGSTVDQWKKLADPEIGGQIEKPDEFKGYFMAIAPGSRSKPSQRAFYNLQRQIAKMHPDPDAPNDETKTSFQFSDDIRCIVDEDKYYHLSRISFDTRKEEELKPGQTLFKTLVPVRLASGDDEEEEEKPKSAKKTAKKAKPEEEDIDLDDELEELEEEEEEEGDEDEEEDEEEEESEEDEEEESDDDDAESIARTQILKVLKTGPTTHATLTPKVMTAVADMPSKKRKAVLELLNNTKWMTKNKSWNFNADTNKYSAKK